tara:strand:- start:3191 stop:3742 length:552 start_codon:yes stop_codon:yes gene_type:complete
MTDAITQEPTQEEHRIQKKIYRFKFHPETQDHLTYFAHIHKYEDRVTFKENWETWVEDNKKLIDDETRYLENLGYVGNVEQKMFKSVRYYFKNKTNDTQDPVQRRNYISISRNILNMIDNHINNNMNDANYKPATGFVNFMEQNRNVIHTETERIKENNDLTQEIIDLKIKKTYKNRYYLSVN